MVIIRNIANFFLLLTRWKISPKSAPKRIAALDSWIKATFKNDKEYLYFQDVQKLSREEVHYDYNQGNDYFQFYVTLVVIRKKHFILGFHSQLKTREILVK